MPCCITVPTRIHLYEKALIQHPDINDVVRLGCDMYRQIPNIRRTKSQNLNVSRLVLQLSLPNLLKPCIKLRIRCSRSSADRRCSNYIWVINNLIAHKGAFILEIWRYWIHRSLMKIYLKLYRIWYIICCVACWRWLHLPIKRWKMLKWILRHASFSHGMIFFSINISNFVQRIHDHVYPNIWIHKNCEILAWQPRFRYIHYGVERSIC